MKFLTTYESLLLEARGEFLWKFFSGEMGKVSKDLGEDTFSIFLKLISIDPTTDANSLDNISEEQLSRVRVGGYSQWIINKFLKKLKVIGGDIRSIKNYYGEDAYKIRAGIEAFSKNYNNIWVTGGKDLNKYDLDKVIGMGVDYLSNDISEEDGDRTTNKDYTVIIENEDIKFCEILTFKGSKELGSNTNFCTAADCSYFNQYNKSSLYIVINKSEYVKFKELRKTSSNYSSIASKYPTRKIQFTASNGGHMMDAPDNVISVDSVKNSIGEDNWQLISDWLEENDTDALDIWNGDSQIKVLEAMVKEAEEYNARNPCKNAEVYYDINNDDEYPFIWSSGVINCNYFNDRFIDFDEVGGERGKMFFKEIEGIFAQHGGISVEIDAYRDYQINVNDMETVHANSGESLVNSDDIQRIYDRVSERIKACIGKYRNYLTYEGQLYWDGLGEDFEWDASGAIEMSSVVVKTYHVKDESVVGIYNKLLVRMLSKYAMKVLRGYFNSSFNVNQMLFTEFGYGEYEEDPRDSFSLRVKCSFNARQTEFIIRISATPTKDKDGYSEPYGIDKIKELNEKIKVEMKDEMFDYYVNLVERVIAHKAKKKIPDIALDNLV